MKKSLFALAVLAVTGAAQAQSSVTLYGIVDAGFRYSTHGGTTGTNTGTNKMEMISGGLGSTRFGLRGTEDLGSGMKAIFNVENRFNTDTGTFSVTNASGNTAAPDGQLFRQAWAGLSTSAGDITLGRQYSVVSDAMLSNYASLGNVPKFQPDIDMLYLPTVGTYGLGSSTGNFASANSTHDGYIFSNSIKYNANFSGVKVGLQYGLGEQAGNYGRGAELAARVGYAIGPVAIDAAAEQVTSSTNVKAKVYTAGGTYVAGPVKLNAGWVARSIATDSSNTNHVNTSMYFGGAKFQATPALSAGLNLFYTKTDASFMPGVNAKVQGLALVTYDLSKRSSLYAEADYTLRAAKDDATNTYKKPFGAMVGLTHRF